MRRVRVGSSPAPVSGLVMCSLRGAFGSEDFREKGFDGTPRAGVAQCVIGDARDVPLIFMREAVFSVAINDELPVGGGGFHFVGEGRHVSERDVRIERSVEDEYFCFD